MFERFKMDKIYGHVSESAPCRSCKNYNDGHVDFNDYYPEHAFHCSGGKCLYCAEVHEFNCYERG